VQTPREHGVKTDGSAAAANAQVLAELVRLIEQGELEVWKCRLTGHREG